MLTDQDLANELRLAFDEATDGISPAAGLGAAVRRGHRAARRRAAALRLAVPAAAATAGGVVVAGGGAGPSSPAPTNHPMATLADGPSVSRSTAQDVAYVLKVPARTNATFFCIDLGSFSNDSDVWYVAGGSGCATMVVDLHTSLPGDAKPIDVAGVPGLYGTSDAKTNSRTIYSRNPDGGDWSSLIVAANTPDDVLRGFYVPSN
jgi:hypothetical protein